MAGDFHHERRQVTEPEHTLGRLERHGVPDRRRWAKTVTGRLPARSWWTWANSGVRGQTQRPGAHSGRGGMKTRRGIRRARLRQFKPVRRWGRRAIRLPWRNSKGRMRHVAVGVHSDEARCIQAVRRLRDGVAGAEPQFRKRAGWEDPQATPDAATKALLLPILAGGDRFTDSAWISRYSGADCQGASEPGDRLSQARYLR